MSTVWFGKWKGAVPQLERHKSEKAEGTAQAKCSLVGAAQIPLTNGKNPNQKCPSLRRGWGQGRLQFIAHSEIKISPNSFQ